MRHKWVKLRLHVYICGKCGMGKVNANEAGHWVTTYHLPSGESRPAAHTPPCAPGALTAKYLAKYAHAFNTPF